MVTKQDLINININCRPGDGHEFYEDKETDTQYTVTKLDDDLVICFQSSILELKEYTKFKWLDWILSFFRSKDWTNNFDFILEDGVSRGIIRPYKRIRDHIIDVVSRNPEKNLYITGYSRGGALATVCFLDLVNAGSKAKLVTFNNQRCLSWRKVWENRMFKEYAIRYYVKQDLVSYLPLFIWGFKHFGNKEMTTTDAKGIEAAHSLGNC